MPDCDKTNKTNVSLDTERNKKMNEGKLRTLHGQWNDQLVRDNLRNQE